MRFCSGWRSVPDARVAAETGQARIALLGHQIADARKERDQARGEAKSAGKRAVERRATPASPQP